MYRDQDKTAVETIHSLGGIFILRRFPVCPAVLQADIYKFFGPLAVRGAQLLTSTLLLLSRGYRTMSTTHSQQALETD